MFLNNNNKKKYKTKFKYATKTSNIDKLEVGDYIVHSINGIGIYNGLKYLLENIEELKKYKKNLKNYKYDNSIIIKELEGVLSNETKIKRNNKGK